MTLRKVRVYAASDGDGHFDQMDEYSDRGEYYYADDVDAELKQLKSQLDAAIQIGSTLAAGGSLLDGLAAALTDGCEGCLRLYPKNEAGNHVWPSGIGGGDFRKCSVGQEKR